MISLAAGTVLDAPPADVLAAAAAAGYDAAGLRLDPARHTVAEARQLRRQAEELGLRLLDLEVLRLGPDRSLDDHRRLLDLAEALGAHHLLTVSQHHDRAATVDDLGRLLDAARGARTRVALEFMRFTEVATLGDAVAVLDAVGADHAVVLVDALHLQRGGESPDALDAVPAGRLGYLQLCDAPAAAPGDVAALADEARHRRLSPGDGQLPLTALLDHAPAGLPVSVEVQSDRLTAELAPEARARLLLAATRRVLSAATAGRSRHG